MKFLDGDVVVLRSGAKFANFGVMAGHINFRLTGAQNVRVNPSVRERRV